MFALNSFWEEERGAGFAGLGTEKRGHRGIWAGWGKNQRHCLSVAGLGEALQRKCQRRDRTWEYKKKVGNFEN